MLTNHTFINAMTVGNFTNLLYDWVSQEELIPYCWSTASPLRALNDNVDLTYMRLTHLFELWLMKITYSCTWSVDLRLEMQSISNLVEYQCMHKWTWLEQVICTRYLIRPSSPKAQSFISILREIIFLHFLRRQG